MYSSCIMDINIHAVHELRTLCNLESYRMWPIYPFLQVMRQLIPQLFLIISSYRDHKRCAFTIHFWTSCKRDKPLWRPSPTDCFRLPSCPALWKMMTAKALLSIAIATALLEMVFALNTCGKSHEKVGTTVQLMNTPEDYGVRKNRNFIKIF